ncbi:hypothetical protein J1605_008443 [Eschrichtius robustus]|uniref:Uncharacterized protein n=1 Tax=Eschrichtius robustus TaxID=9764 RepID=A0AB34GUY2_ESCRO|nr:hypothetical protein J1605_008443 [Eschrichtius robustus]
MVSRRGCSRSAASGLAVGCQALASRCSGGHTPPARPADAPCPARPWGGASRAPPGRDATAGARRAFARSLPAALYTQPDRRSLMFNSGLKLGSAE